MVSFLDFLKTWNIRLFRSRIYHPSRHHLNEAVLGQTLTSSLLTILYTCTSTDASRRLDKTFARIRSERNRGSFDEMSRPVILYGDFQILNVSLGRLDSRHLPIKKLIGRDGMPSVRNIAFRRAREIPPSLIDIFVNSAIEISDCRIFPNALE